ncbi:MAG TPA: ribosomal-processing cysteine protease Prp [Bacillales bacterium]|nr:ribosomal-processing cysteine protease Prp [Bacillales bacterium]
MITVKVKREQERIVSFSLRGHADAGPYGHDLVCAGVSAVSIGTENAVHALCGVRLKVEQDEKAGGFLECTVPEDLEDETDEKVQLLLEGMVVSLEAIVLEYDQYIQFTD